MSHKLKETEKLRAALRIAVDGVKPIRAKIRTTKEWERYTAWNEKRAGQRDRRVLHLALCYMNGTPYRKAEALSTLDDAAVPEYQRRDWRDTLVGEVATVLGQFGCTSQEKLSETRDSVRVWMGKEPAVVAALPAPRPLKLYVVVREDLPPGAQAVQAAHAMREFAAEHPELEREWHEKSNTVVMLSTSETHLGYLLAQAKLRGIETSLFREPDLGNMLTAVCFGTKGYKLPLRNLALALSECAA